MRYIAIFSYICCGNKTISTIEIDQNEIKTQQENIV